MEGLETYSRGYRVIGVYKAAAQQRLSGRLLLVTK